MNYTLLLLIGAVLTGGTGYWFYDDFEPELLRGKNVLITGASMGIGEQMAYYYARMGARVMITARSEDRLKKVVEHCREVGNKDGLYIYFVADMSNMNDTETLIQVAIERLGSIDFLILNHVYLSSVQPFLSTKDALSVMHETMDVNFFAYVHLAYHAVPVLQQSKGSIVVLSTVAGRVSQTYLLPYSTTKFAIEGFFGGLRAELQSREISLTMCYLGLVDTNNVMTSLSNYSKITTYAKPANSSKVAYDIVRGGALRLREVFSPYLIVKFLFLFNTVAPNLLQSLLNYLYS